MRSFVAGVSIGLLFLVSFLAYQNYNHSCPCGFKYDPLTGGCQVDLQSGPCGPGSGGNTPGNNPGGGGSSGTFQAPVDVPIKCTIRVANCAVSADWKGAEFTLFDTGGTVSTSPTKLPVTLRVSQQDKNGAGCAQIKGSIEVALNAVTKLPFDAGALAASFPMVTTSAGGVPPGTIGLIASFNDPCRGTETGMLVFPSREEECGCKASFKRD